MPNVGRIRNLNEPDSTPQPQIISQQQKPSGVEVEPQTVDVTVHEEVIREGQSSVRKPGEDDGIEIRARHAVNPKAWNDVKRGNE